MTILTKQAIEKIEIMLRAKKENLEKELSGFATKDSNVKGDWDSKYPRVPEGNIEDAATEVEEYSTSLPIEYSLETQLQNVNSALEKIKKGTYGTCQICGKEIEEERLLAAPEGICCASHLKV